MKEIARALAVVVGLSRLGCGGHPTAPVRENFPKGLSDATALKNLSLIRKLEQASRSRTGLVKIFAQTNEAGVARFGWEYRFERLDQPSESQDFVWTVETGGQISFHSVSWIAQCATPGMDLAVRIDSDKAVALARAAGLDEIVRRFPGDPRFVVTYLFLGTGPAVVVRFITEGGQCPASWVMLDPVDGRVVSGELSCRPVPARICF